MATSLLDLAKNIFSDERINRLSEYLGENEIQTRTALEGALPTLLGGMVQRSNEPGGMDRLLALFRQNQPVGDEGAFFDRLGDRIDGDDEFRRMNSTGSSLLTTLFGDKSNDVTDAISSYSGVSSGSALSLLSLAGSVLLGLLSRRLGTEGASAAGMTAFLAQQRDTVNATMPSRLGALLGAIPGLGSFSGATGAATAVATTALPRVDPVASVTGPRPTDGPVVEPRRAEAIRETRSGMGSWVPWVLLLAGIIALIYFLRSCGSRDEAAATADSTRTEMGQAADNLAAEADTVATDIREGAENAADRLGAFAKRNLPTGISLNLPERGVENRLIAFLDDKGRVVDKTTWFDFDRLLFETGSDRLVPSSEEQLKNVAEIMKAYPNVNVKIGGYTDDQGDAGMNLQLSTDRAKAVRAELIRLGVAANRLEAEGYGETNPVASNDNEVGRQKNRRVSIRVTKK